MDVNSASVLNTLSGKITRGRAPASQTSTINANNSSQAANATALTNADSITISKAAQALNTEEIKAVSPVNSKPNGAEKNTETEAEEKTEGKTETKAEKSAEQASKTDKQTTQLTEEDLKQVQDLKKRDSEVRRHEAAHLSAAGKYATGGPSYDVERGPDGKNYAVGGEVGIDTSPIAGDPQATVQKAQQVRAAAQAPANPSSQDRQIAASASQMETQARQEISQQSLGNETTTQKPEAEGSTENQAATEQGNGQKAEQSNVQNSTANNTQDSVKNNNSTNSSSINNNSINNIRAASVYALVGANPEAQKQITSLIDLVA